MQIYDAGLYLDVESFMAWCRMSVVAVMTGKKLQKTKNNYKIIFQL